ncbi:hypothetical protein AC578_5771 [Pseudocercospora eumusae]|uniref:Uncharacterized protein n=1 Tax=Pseudocercospora eumusae TaxID=321146 RepID=A0A139H599_9PEZI|nr:hypothetical protein AC578_5771 [Pseudocercospora eumusae]
MTQVPPDRYKLFYLASYNPKPTAGAQSDTTATREERTSFHTLPKELCTGLVLLESPQRYASVCAIGKKTKFRPERLMNQTYCICPLLPIIRRAYEETSRTFEVSLTSDGAWQASRQSRVVTRELKNLYETELQKSLQQDEDGEVKTGGKYESEDSPRVYFSTWHKVDDARKKLGILA